MSNVVSNSYNKVNTGKLKLKGSSLGTKTTQPPPSTTNGTTAVIGIKRPRENDIVSTGPSRTLGQGKITVSGTTVMGKDTSFLNQIASGDAIEIEFVGTSGEKKDSTTTSSVSSLSSSSIDHSISSSTTISSSLSSTTSTTVDNSKDTLLFVPPSSIEPLPHTISELRVVKFVVSDKNLCISQPFNNSVNPSGMDYYILKLPKQMKDSSIIQQEEVLKKKTEQEQAIGIATSKYHDHKYRDVQVPPMMISSKSTTVSHAGSSTTGTSGPNREDLLLYRAKKKSDKYC